MNSYEYAENELSRLDSSSEEQKTLNEDILKIVDEFGKHEYTGYIARYVIQVLERLLRFKPLSSLSGEDEEWEEVEGEDFLQNKRCPSVFKEKDGCVSDTDSKIVSDDGGLTWFQSNEVQTTNIEFPYWPPTTPEEIYVEYIGETKDGEQEYEIITEDEERIKELRKKKLEEQAKQNTEEESDE